MSESKLINSTIDHVFRQEYSRLISFLTAKFGTENIDRIEDAVQDALYKAMKLWSFQDMPEKPGNWLYKVAHNGLIDNLRRSRKSVEFNPAIADQKMGEEYFPEFENIEDEQLKMIFACCHPSMKESEQIMLSLKLLCGFSNQEIARALFKKSEAVKKAIARAKQKFKTEIGQLELPEERKLKERLRAVLKVIYLLFNNGYTAYDGDALLKKDVCEDAMRLASTLYKKEDYNTVENRALLSLMCFNYSRFDARTDANGNMLTMEYQDRKLWNTHLIRIGLRFMNESASGDQLSSYHLEAAIAAEYATSKDFQSINWAVILERYNLLIAIKNTPSVALNRLVILQKVEGAELAYKELLKLDKKIFLSNHLYYSIKADFEKKLNDPRYKKSLTTAIDLTANQKEKAFLLSKM